VAQPQSGIDPTWRETLQLVTTATFESRFDHLYALAYRVAYRIIGSREEANDVAQESLARASARWPSVADHAEAWVATVAGRLAIDYWRARRRREAATLVAERRSDDQHLGERLDLVRGLRGLPRRQRQIVVLRYLADRSEADVAALLGCSVGTVKAHASRGLAALRTALEPARSDQGGGGQ
jgi:RNA polymerase sigma factor (sigma-70 family)